MESITECSPAQIAQMHLYNFMAYVLDSFGFYKSFSLVLLFYLDKVNNPLDPCVIFTRFMYVTL